jgi:peptidylprolyl isomerase
MNLMRRNWWTVLLLLAGLVLVACGPAAHSGDAQPDLPGMEAGDEEEATDEVAHEEDETSTESGDSAEGGESVVTSEGGSTITASGLEYVEIEAGSGPIPQPGDIVAVHYTGTLEDGTEFDSSVGGEPFRFTLGQGEVIPGWDEGIALMHEGGKGKLIVPPELAYGSSGSGPIPPDATLIFDVELVSVQATPKPTDIAAEDYITTDSGLKYYIFEEGDGDAPQEGDLVSVDFELWLEDGTFLDSTIDRGTPYTFILGSDSSLPGLDEGLVLLKEGGKAQLTLPPEIADGSGATYVFEITLLETQEPPMPTAVDEADYTVTDSGLKYYAITEGSGELPQAGDSVSIHYTLWLEDGTMVDSSVQRGLPLDMFIGSGGTIPGFEEGVTLTREGGKAQIVVPPALGYGETGGGPIPPNANLIFEIEVLEITPAQ